MSSNYLFCSQPRPSTPMPIPPLMRAGTPTPFNSPMHRSSSAPSRPETPDPEVTCEDCIQKNRIIVRLNHQIDILEEYIRRNDN